MKVAAIFKFLGAALVVAVVENQFGDAAKGKVVDLFAVWADIIARGTGGGNAGHTIWINGVKYVFHLIPCGILYDRLGKLNVIGNGVAFDPSTACHELDVLDTEGQTYNGLRIAHNAKLVLPQHLVMDRVRESSAAAVGSTLRGISPTYLDHYGRLGLTVNDILNPKLFMRKLNRNLTEKVDYLRTKDQGVIREIMNHEHLRNGLYYDRKDIFNVEAIVEAYCTQYAARLGRFVTDTDALLQRAVRVEKKKVLLEGAQGVMLSIDRGTYPFVTSSDPSIEGLAKGVGLRAAEVQRTFSVTKAPYMTRVGSGPFPTELGGKRSEEWCNQKGMNKEKEKKTYPRPNINSWDEFLQGVAMRGIGDCYGSTTGRLRRVGWLDMLMLVYALKINGGELVLTKLDVLDKCKRIKVCMAYQHEGPDTRWGDRVIKTGEILTEFIPDSDILCHCVPLYRELDGWCTPTGHIRSYDKLPKQLKAFVRLVETHTGYPVSILSVGRDRNQTILKF